MAMGAMATPIVHKIPDKYSTDNSLGESDFNMPRMSVLANEQDQVEELEHLMEAGN